MRIAYWPDGCWCDIDEIKEMTHKSDDFAVVELDDELAYEDWQIDEWVRGMIS